MSEAPQESYAQIEVLDLPIVWELHSGIVKLAGVPVVMLWTSSTLAEFLVALHRAVGEQRYGYLLQAQGRESVTGDWEFMSSFPTFFDGLEGINRIAMAAGWGRIELVRYDAERQQAVIHVHNAWEGDLQKSLGVCWGTHYLGGKIAGWFSRHFGINCWSTQQMFIARGDPYDEFLVEQSSLDVAETLAQLEREERERHEQLEVLVEQRTQEMRRAVEDLQQAQRAMRDQARAIEELSTPVVQLWKGILMVPLVGSIDDRRAQRLVETLLTAISEHEADTVLLDITGVTTVDTVVANHLIRTIQAARLLGAHPMLVGISAEIAQTLVTLGVDLSTIPTSANVEQGLQASFRTIGLRITQA